jgi:predicted dehydrogenase
MLRAGVIGVGHLGRFHAQKYAAIDGVKLTGVYDLDPARAKLIAEECGTTAYGTIEELLKEVDLVSIATPATTHFDVAQKTLNAGVNCLVEKPFTRTVEEAQTLVRIAKEKKLVLQVGHLERFNIVISEGAGLIKNPKFIECQRIAPFTARSTDINVILDLMIHDIDLVLSVIKNDILDIDAVGVPVLTDKVDIAHARIVFDKNVIANFTASRISQKVFRKMRVFQPFSYVGLDFQKGEVEVFERVKQGDKFVINGNVMPFGPTDALKKEIESFVSCVIEGKEPLVGGEDAVRTLDVAHRIIKKIKDRTEVL